MAAPLTKVLLIGAGGNLGPAVLKALAGDSQFTVTVLTRNSSTTKLPDYPGLKVIKIDDEYPANELESAFKGQDAVVATLANASVLKQKDFIDAAVKTGVKRFVPSEFGSDIENDKAVELLPMFFNGKKEILEYLKVKEPAGLTWSAFVTGPFFEMGVGTGFMGFDIANRKASLFNGGKDNWSTTTLPTIGLAVRNALLKPAETANKHVYVNSFNLNQNDVVTALEKATGSTWEKEYVEGEALKAEGLGKLDKGDFSGVVDMIRYVNCVSGHGGNYAEYQQTSNSVLGLPKESLDAEVQKLVSASA